MNPKVVYKIQCTFIPNVKMPKIARAKKKVLLYIKV